MSRAERVVDEHVTHAAQPPCEVALVAGFSSVEAEVLQQQHVAVAHACRVSFGRVADTVGSHHHLAPKKLGQTRRHGLERHRSDDLALGSPKVRGKDRPAAGLDDVSDRGESSPDARVVGDGAVGSQWHVEVNARQNAFTPQVEIRDVQFSIHGNRPHLPATSFIMSTMREAYPASLSYQPKILTRSPPMTVVSRLSKMHEW